MEQTTVMNPMNPIVYSNKVLCCSQDKIEYTIFFFLNVGILRKPLGTKVVDRRDYEQSIN